MTGGITGSPVPWESAKPIGGVGVWLMSPPVTAFGWVIMNKTCPICTHPLHPAGKRPVLTLIGIIHSGCYDKVVENNEASGYDLTHLNAKTRRFIRRTRDRKVL